ncbi:hypothetical protein BZL30_6390 [Mycobacterium kansasii]|uniref:Uncharacterized protein n=1 Tax=Mycobacterium kansasii TaxID=1768 RepID=A0A1V3WTW9_MYCKA|nr:hypothetical protein BZL30_6390 [Mycobacterium kansasii]
MATVAMPTRLIRTTPRSAPAASAAQAARRFAWRNREQGNGLLINLPATCRPQLPTPARRAYAHCDFTKYGRTVVIPRTARKGAAGGAFISSDAVLCGDDPELLDHERGIPHCKGFAGRIVKLAEPLAFSTAARRG